MLRIVLIGLERLRRLNRGMFRIVLIVKQLDMVLPHTVFLLPARALSLTPAASWWQPFPVLSALLAKALSFSWLCVSTLSSCYYSPFLPNISLYPSATLEELIEQFMCIHLHPVLIPLPASPLSPTPNGTSLVTQPNDKSPTYQQVGGLSCPGITPRQIFSLERV